MAAPERPGSGFDAFLAALDYPVYVVTAVAADERAGCLVGFAGQSSIEPPRFTVWLSKANRTYDVAVRAEVLAVHSLPRGATALARLFGERTADDGVDKFARVPWTPGPGGVPVLAEAVGWFAGRVLARVDGGDHVAFLLEPVEGAGDRTGPVLGYGDVRDLDAGHPTAPRGADGDRP